MTKTGILIIALVVCLIIIIGLLKLSSAIDFHKKYYNNFKLYLKLKV